MGPVRGGGTADADAAAAELENNPAKLASLGTWSAIKVLHEISLC